MSRTRLITASGILAGVAANYWLLEGLLAARTDRTEGWISDLGARSESTGWVFDLLDAGSGLLLLAFALLVRPTLAGRGPALRWGSVALITVGVCSLIDGAFPLSCAESLSASCKLDHDLVDLIHVAETFIAIVATIAAFGLLAAGLLAETSAGLRRLGAITMLAGLLWIACNVAMGASYPIEDLKGVRGSFHRASQLVAGGWLIVLAVALPGALVGAGRGPRRGRQVDLRPGR